MTRRWWPLRDPDDGLLTTPRRGVRGAHRAQGTEWPVLAAVVLALLVVSLALVVLLVYLAQARACPPSSSPVRAQEIEMSVAAVNLVISTRWRARGGRCLCGADRENLSLIATRDRTRRARHREDFGGVRWSV